MAPFPLLNLPEELISAMASQVHTPASLALTSKQLNRITTPHLYAHISLRLGTQHSDYGMLHALVISLLSRPHIAELVRSLHIRGDWIKNWDAWSPCRVDELHPLLRDKVEKLTVDRLKKRTWAQNGVGWNRTEALVAVLIHSLPHLMVLDAHAPELPGMHYRWLMRRLSSTPARALLKLTQLELVFPPETLIVEEKEYMSFFRLPCLKRVILGGVAARTTNHDDPGGRNLLLFANHLAYACERRAASAERLSAVEHLEIRDGWHSFPPACDLILVCRALHTFAYQIHLKNDPSRPTGLDTFLLKALETHADSLEYLHLGAMSSIDRSSALNVPDLTTLPSLKHFELATSTALAFCHPEPLLTCRMDELVHKLPLELNVLTLFNDCIAAYPLEFAEAVFSTPSLWYQFFINANPSDPVIYRAVNCAAPEKRINRAIVFSQLVALLPREVWHAPHEHVHWTKVARLPEYLGGPWVGGLKNDSCWDYDVNIFE